MRFFLLVALLLAPGAAAWTDPAGDVVLAHPAGTTPDEHFSHVDLASLEILEDPGGFWFWVGLHALEAETDGVGTLGSTIHVPFAVGGQEYDLRLGRGGAEVLYYYASLRIDGEYVWGTDTFRSDDVRVDEETQRIGARVQRHWFEGAWKGQDMVAGPVRAEARPWELVDPWGTPPETQPAVVARDEMEVGPLPLRWGVRPQGVMVEVADPVRQTNGEAASHLFLLNVTSQADGVFAVDLDAPDAWRVDAPAAIRLEAGEVQSLPVVVTVPFAHAHGTIEAVTVGIEGEAGAGGVALGIHALDIPQPAGHHDTLYLHSRTVAQGRSALLQEVVPQYARTPLFASTLETDPADVGRPVPASVEHGMETIFWWAAEMQPAWRVPLDVESGGEGHFAASFELPPGITGDVSVRLLARGIDGGGPTSFSHPYQSRPTLILFEGTGTIAGDGRAEVPLQAAVGGRIEVPEDGQLIVEIRMVSTVPAPPTSATVPSLLPGASMQLALTDVDVVGEAEIPAAFHLRPAHRLANAGDALLFDIDAPGTDWTPAGTWPARVVGGALVVDVPPDALPGQRVRVFALGEVGVALATVEVVEEPVDDDAAAIARLIGGHEAPAPVAALVVGLLLADRWRRGRARP